jgi:hypothetical protein
MGSIFQKKEFTKKEEIYTNITRYDVIHMKINRNTKKKYLTHKFRQQFKRLNQFKNMVNYV